LERVRSADRALRRAEERGAVVSGLASAAQLIATGLAVVGALVIGAYAVASGQLAAVQLAVLVLTPLALHEVTAGLPTALQVGTRSRAALRRVAELLAAPAVGTGDRPADQPGATAAGSVTARHLSAGWPGRPPAVADFDLDVRAGERVALVGPSGSGKTTVAATLMGLLPPTSGTVEVTGSVGYLAQDAYLFDTTVAENVRIGRRDATDDDVSAALRQARLDLDPARLVGEHGTQVSGGEARRIAAARVLLAEHGVLILDEPTEHLDRPTADALLDDLFALAGPSAVLVITHDPVVIARCDRVVELGRRSDPAVLAGLPGRFVPVGDGQLGHG
jgi:ABC-type transport system involved in cytochrome bd biosynthesis fused ATPase/permease subunit